MEVKESYAIKFFLEKGMKKVEIIDRLNKYDGWNVLQ
jgi:hypothetical protein